MTPPELNYDIYNKKLLRIVVALKEWKAFLQNTKKLFIIKTNHKIFTRFLIIKKLSQKQVKWTEMLIEYYFKIKHVKGSDNAKADIFNKKKPQNNNKVSRALLK